MAATELSPNTRLLAANELAGKPVLVTGATGFIGSHLTRLLLAHKANVHVLTSTVSSVYPQRLLTMRNSITLHEGNLADRSAMDAVAGEVRPQLIFHLGAYTHVGKSWQRVDECIQANIQGTVNLLQSLAPYGYQKFVYTGTSEIYGDVDVPFVESGPVNPISPYSVSKYAGERYCRMLCKGRGWPITLVRPFNVYGPAQSPDRVVPEIIVRALRGQPLLMTNGIQTREFNFVSDIAEGFLAAGVRGEPGRVYNIGSGLEISMRDLATKILKLMGEPILAQFGALPDRPTEIWRMFSDSTRAREELGWSPKVSLETGLSETISWYSDELAHRESSFAV